MTQHKRRRKNCLEKKFTSLEITFCVQYVNATIHAKISGGAIARFARSWLRPWLGICQLRCFWNIWALVGKFVACLMRVLFSLFPTRLPVYRACLWSSKSGVPNLSLTMYPFSIRQRRMYPLSISKDKHVPLQHFAGWTCAPNFLWQNFLSWFIADIFKNKHITAF